MTERTVELTGERLDRTVQIDSVDNLVVTHQVNYVLSELDFERMTKSTNRLFGIALAFFGAAIPYLLEAVKIYIPLPHGAPLPETLAGQLHISLIAGTIGIVLLLIGALLPNAKRATIKTIRLHFKKHQNQNRRILGNVDNHG